MGPFNRSLGGLMYRIWCLLDVVKEGGFVLKREMTLTGVGLIFRRKIFAVFHGEKLEKVTSYAGGVLRDEFKSLGLKTHPLTVTHLSPVATIAL